MTDSFKSMITGDSTSTGAIEVVAPFDLSPIALVETSGADAVDQALNTADQLFRDRSRWLPVSQRIAILEKTAAIMAERMEELAIEAAREGGKPLIDSRVEVVRAIDSIRICVDCLRTESGETIPMGINTASAGRLAFTSREPIGVVVAISAFNHPLNLISHQVGPAIAAGCPVIVKPAEDTPLSCYRFVESVREAGLPDEWCQALVTSNLDVATQLVTDARVAFLSFIGSAKVGWILRSKLAPGTRCALEHGGAAPVIFAEDIDTAFRAYKRLNASAVMVNDHTAFRVDWMPFAGLRESGLGVGGIPYTFRDMQTEKVMVVNSKELI